MFKIENLPDEDISNSNWRGGSVLVTPTEPIKVSEEIIYEPRPCVTLTRVSKSLERMRNFQVRDDDVWIVTFPKCGTTWAQEMCWLILNDLDYETASKVDLIQRSPFWEFSSMLPSFPYDTMEFTENLKSPRLIKSHLALPLLPKEIWERKPKIIYVSRDPRDAAISFYHHWIGFGGFQGSKEVFLKAFVEDQISPGPFWQHLLEFWRLREQPFVLFLTYEEMKSDLEGVIRKVANFFKKTITEQQLEKLMDHLSFKNMKKNPSCNHEKEKSNLKQPSEKNTFQFMRRGEVGSYKDEFPEEYKKRFAEWTKKNLEGTDCKLYLSNS